MSYFRKGPRSLRGCFGDDTSSSSGSPAFTAGTCDPTSGLYYQNYLPQSQWAQMAAQCQSLGAGPTCPSPVPDCASVAGVSFFDVGVTNPSLPVGCQCNLPSGSPALWNGVTLAPVAGGALSTADVAALQAAGWTSGQMGRSGPVSTTSNPFGTLVPAFANSPGGISGTGLLLIGSAVLGIFLLSGKPKPKTAKASVRRGAP